MLAGGRPFLTICGVRLSDADADEEALAVAMGGVADEPTAPPDAAVAAAEPALAVAFSCFSTASVMDDSCGAKKERRAARGSLLLSLRLFSIANAIAIAMIFLLLSHACLVWLRWRCSCNDDGGGGLGSDLAVAN